MPPIGVNASPMGVNDKLKNKIMTAVENRLRKPGKPLAEAPEDTHLDDPCKYFERELPTFEHQQKFYMEEKEFLCGLFEQGIDGHAFVHLSKVVI